MCNILDTDVGPDISVVNAYVGKFPNIKLYSLWLVIDGTYTWIWKCLALQVGVCK